ncbi:MULTISPECIES: helix-turn-helix transcriptional regulator [Roseomonadaceae]|nr:DNA-binding protein [Roseomonas oleicola]
MEPRYLSREEAAAYLGVSLDTFLGEVARGEWPPPRLRGAEGQRLTWDRRALDAAADQASGLCPSPPEVAAAMRAGAEAAAIAGAQNAQAGKQRAQRRQA